LKGLWLESLGALSSHGQFTSGLRPSKPWSFGVGV